MTSSSHPEPLAVLSDLKEGTTAVLGEFDVAPQVAEHLMNLGLIPGIEVTAAHSGPGGDPRIYRVDGTEIAIRRDLACRIAVVHVRRSPLTTSPTRRSRKDQGEA